MGEQVSAGDHRSTVLVPRASTLDGFAAEVSAADGINVNDLEPLTTLVVRTCNSLYRIIVSQRTSILVQGGQFFPEMTPAHLSGSGFGGSLLKIAWIGIGLRMEICVGGQRIVTSPVRTIATEGHQSAPPPH